MKEQFVVVAYNGDLIICLEICDDYHRAVGVAYDYASEISYEPEFVENDGKEATVTPLCELDGGTGVSLKVCFGNDEKAKIYVLKYAGKEYL